MSEDAGDLTGEFRQPVISQQERPGVQQPTSLNPHAPEFFSSNEAPASEVKDSLVDMMTAQTTAYKEMANSIKFGMSLPKPELRTFSGDPTEYWQFICNFDASLGASCDALSRLNFLVQHCQGDARKAIEGCVILEPEVGYQKARKILNV